MPDVISEIESAIKSICKLWREEVSYATKMNALDALPDIADSICSGPKEAKAIRPEVQDRFRRSYMYHSTLTRATKDIVNGLSPDERDEVRRAGWTEQLREVVNLAERRDTLEGLRNVLDLLEESDEDGKEDEGTGGGTRRIG